MTNREKVVKGLKCCTAFNGFHQCQPKVGDDCPYEDDVDCKLTLMADALELLKEQELVKPEVYYVGQDKYKFYRCPVCKIAWHYKGNYCLGCGRAVKWE